jgi:hypothetical protein
LHPSRHNDFLFAAAFKPVLRPTRTSYLKRIGVLSSGTKRPDCEADHWPPSRAKVKNARNYTTTPSYIFMAWCLIKNKDNVAFYSTAPTVISMKKSV